MRPEPFRAHSPATLQLVFVLYRYTEYGVLFIFKVHLLAIAMARFKNLLISCPKTHGSDTMKRLVN